MWPDFLYNEMSEKSSLISLKENYEFVRAYRRGKSYVSPVLVAYVFKNRKKSNRVGITTSKKIGKAVKRNRARRVIRAAYRNLSQQCKQGYDIVFVARTRTAYVKSTEVQKHMELLLNKAGILD